MIAIFLTAGYPEPVARLLTGLCTNTVPLAVWNQAGRLELDPARSRRDLAGPAAVPPAAPAPGCSDLAGPGQPGRLPARRAAGRPGQRGRGQLHPLRRRPGLLRRRGLRAVDRPVPDPRRRDRARGRLRRPAPQDAGHAPGGPATRRRGRDQSEDQYARDDYDQLKAILCNCVRHGPHEQNRAGVADFRAAPGRPRCACRAAQSRAGPAADAVVRADRLVSERSLRGDEP